VTEHQASILLVDDREENLLALRAILEPLGQTLVAVTSGAAALRELLREEFACVLLDVQMPDLDGFQLAELIKQRQRSEHIPIIFVTALSKETQHVFRGYSAGAVDYIFKPIDPDVLRSKVSVFVELWQKNRQLQEQERLLHEQHIGELARASEERYRRLADAMPQMVWTADASGSTTYLNRRWFETTGLGPGEPGSTRWYSAVHPEDLPLVRAARNKTLRSGESFELEARFRTTDGTYRWHLVRVLPIRAEAGDAESWIGTATDIDDRRRAEDLRGFVASAGELLSASLDYSTALASVAELAVQDFAHFCAVHLARPDRSLAEVAVAHRDPGKAPFVRELLARQIATGDAGAAAVVRAGETELTTDAERAFAGTGDELESELLAALEPRSAICVPLTARNAVFGAITFVSAEGGHLYGAEELFAAQEVARRAATALENARLYREAAERAEAARVLATIADGVALVDRSGTVRLWNVAAERILGVPEPEALGRKLADVIPAWATVESRVRIGKSGEPVRAERVPIELSDREAWLSITAVGFDDGVVYAFGDLEQERALEAMRHDLVATVSHELRTPIAAIFGAAVTLCRTDIEIDPQIRGKLLEVISDESGRLAGIVDDLLLASQLDAGNLTASVERCDAVEIAELELAAARAHVPENVELVLHPHGDVPEVAADPGQLRQVLANLIENAVKYSPDGGAVEVSVAPAGKRVRIAVTDSGLGIPPEAQRRIFEKFYRLDPNMDRGIGGTGLGLYISSELVRRVDGRIWVESDGKQGSTFYVELPCASEVPATRPLRVAS
jgi:PAS domain S-box-containing protein